MGTRENGLEMVRATFHRLGLAETDVPRIDATIARRPSGDGSALGLPKVTITTQASDADGGADLVALRELGRGGMGVVQLAMQHSLEREVAIKTGRTADAAVTRALVREARIMGSLEHPNLVPVHAFGVDSNGAPVIVMKRIEGVSWRDLMQQPDHAGWKPVLAGHGDRLRAHLEILSQVCRAVAFAHDRGVVHRDIKPENVMIGRFGEVYLLDWGVALRLAERDREPHGIVGTPGYLAPEMVHGDPARIDERTDTYLLGATLFEVLTGRMPHDASSVMAALAASLMGDLQPFPDDVPADLQALATSAMSTDPARRPQTAEEFRAGLARHLVAREAEGVVQEASASLARAEELVRSEGAPSAAAFRSLIEARFGFTAALRMRPGDPRLQQQLESTIARLVERDIAHRSPTAARALLSELSTPPDTLVARIRTLEEEIARENAAREQFAESRRAADPSAMVRPLSIAILIAVFVTGFAIFPILSEAMRSRGEFPVRHAIAFDVSMLGLLVGLLAWFRKRLFATEGSRRVTYSYAAFIVSIFVADFITFAAGRSTIEATSHSLGTSGFVAAFAALTVLREFWPIAIVHMTACLATLLAPRFAPVAALVALTTDVPLLIRAFRLNAARHRNSEGTVVSDVADRAVGGKPLSEAPRPASTR